MLCLLLIGVASACEYPNDAITLDHHRRAHPERLTYVSRALRLVGFDPGVRAAEEALRVARRKHAKPAGVAPSTERHSPHSSGRGGAVRSQRVASGNTVSDFFGQVWAWILDWWWILLLIAAIAAIVFTKPMKRPRRPDDDPPNNPPNTPFGGGWGV
jgi:hypothetical protein